MTLKARIASLLAGAAFFVAGPLVGEGQTRLIQSIPTETELANPELAYAKDTWVELIHSAKQRLDFGEFYIANVTGGTALDPVLAELEAASARGVKIRFILSNKMLDQDPQSVARLKAIKNLELRIFDMKGVSGGIIHAKYFLVDGKEGYLGSQNFDWRALEHIHELGVRSSDPAIVDRLQEVFELDWRFALNQAVPPAAPAKVLNQDFPPVELVASPAFLNPPSVRPAITALVQLVNSAQKHIQIQLLTYSPLAGKGHYWPAIDEALRAASVRGVKVELMVSDWMYKGRGLAFLKSLAVLPNITVRVVSVPEAKAGHIAFARTVHSKYMIIDDSTLWVGTSNWEEDYFTASRNVEVILRQPALAAQAGELYRRLTSATFTVILDPAKSYQPRKVD